MLKVECINCAGAELELTSGRHYTVIEIEGGNLMVCNDAGLIRWYSVERFASVHT